MEEFNIRITQNTSVDETWDIEVTGRKEESTMLYGSTKVAHAVEQEAVLDIVDFLMYDITEDWPV